MKMQAARAKCNYHMNPEITHVAHPAGYASLRTNITRTGVLTALLLLLAGNANAMEIAEWRFQTSLYTMHWSDDPDHVNNSKLLNLEFETTKRWIYGFAYFDNSFGQPSEYLYAGYSWRLFSKDWAYFKLPAVSCTVTRNLTKTRFH